MMFYNKIYMNVITFLFMAELLLLPLLLFSACDDNIMETINNDALTVAPVAGGFGTLLQSNIDSESITIQWQKASDDRSSPEELLYQIVYSTGLNIVTVADLHSVDYTTDWIVDIDNYTVSDLSSGTSYYFNVAVKDTDGNISLYKSFVAMTP